MKTSLLLTGIGLRPPHYQEVLDKRPGIAWLEVVSENYFGEGGKAISNLEKIRHDYPISLHGTGLSLGSADELNWSHLKKIRDLCHRIEPCLVSEHLSWSSINGHYLHDLLPLPYTEETLTHLCERVQQVQDYLQRQILIENISSYVTCVHSTIPEWEFLQALAMNSQCGILLDINNVYVSAMNLGFSAENYIRAINPDYVQELHLAGFTTETHHGQNILIDTHNRPVAPAVWELFRFSIRHLGRKATIIEWDSDLPSLESLCYEAERAEEIMRNSHEFAKSAS